MDGLALRAFPTVSSMGPFTHPVLLGTDRPPCSRSGPSTALLFCSNCFLYQETSFPQYLCLSKFCWCPVDCHGSSQKTHVSSLLCPRLYQGLSRHPSYAAVDLIYLFVYESPVLATVSFLEGGAHNGIIIVPHSGPQTMLCTEEQQVSIR